MSIINFDIASSNEQQMIFCIWQFIITKNKLSWSEFMKINLKDRSIYKMYIMKSYIGHHKCIYKFRNIRCVLY